MVDKVRCKWCNLKNKLYVEYHDKEWGIPNFNEHNLFEMLILDQRIYLDIQIYKNY